MQCNSFQDTRIEEELTQQLPYINSRYVYKICSPQIIYSKQQSTGITNGKKRFTMNAADFMEGLRGLWFSAAEGRQGILTNRGIT